MFKRLLVTSAVASALALSPAIAQQQGAGDFGNTGQNQQWIQAQAQNAGAQIYFSPASIRQIQLTLNRMGYDVGRIDGQWDSQTAQAVRAYQRTQGLSPTGTLTLSVINELGAGNLLGGSQGNQAVNQQWAQERSQASSVPVFVSPSGIRLVQQSLNQRGFSVGQVDGLWSRSTALAVRDFQRSAGLEPTGQLNTRLIAALGGSLLELANAPVGSRGRNASMQWAQEQARSQGTPLWASPALVRQVQQALNRSGYNTGAVYGQWSNPTQQAVWRYQQAQGLEPTGTLTTSLLSSLGINWMNSQASQDYESQGGYNNR